MDEKKYIIFDLDGTLVDSFTTVANACKRVFEKHASNSIPDSAFFENYRHKDMEQMFADLAVYANMDTAVFREEYDREYELDCLTGTTIIKRQLDTLKNAKFQGIGAIVITNKRQNLAEKVCQNLFSNNEIDVIIGRKDVTPIKPRHVLKERLLSLGIAPSQCLKYIGDSDVDRQSAEMLNIPYEQVQNK